MMVLVTGASSSGKSAWAENRLMEFGIQKRIYVAAMIPWDEECLRRIEKHRAMRAEKGFVTLECPRDLKDAPIEAGSAVLLECLSNLTANEMFRDDKDQLETSPGERIYQGLLELKRKAEDLVVVTNEVFSDGMEYSRETKEYMEILGSLNRKAADMADQVVEVVCGIPICLEEHDQMPGGAKSIEN